MVNVSPTLLLLLSLCLLARAYKPQCLDYIEWVGNVSDVSDTNNINSIKNRILQQLRYSGIGYNSQGDYYSCINQKNRSYYVLELCPGKSTIFPVFYALCLNKSCTGDDVKKLIDNLDVLLKVKKVIEPALAQQDPKIPPWKTNLTVGLMLGFALLTAGVSILHATRLANMKDNRKFRYLNVFAIQNSLMNFSKVSQGEVKCLNGIRGVCLLLVIVGQELVLFVDTRTIINLDGIELVDRSFLVSFILSFFLSIDVLFYISGFTFGYLFPKLFMRQGKWLFLTYSLRKVLRAWPVYFLCILIYQFVMPVFGSGPFFWQAASLTASCRSSLWQYLLFLGNFFEMCMQWVWYVQVDVQLFLLSLGMLFVYTMVNRKISKFMQWSSILTSLLYVAWVCFFNTKYELWTSVRYLKSEYFQQYTHQVFEKPWSRIPSYIFGLSIGIFYFEFKDRDHKKYFMVHHVSRAIKKLPIRVACFISGVSIIIALAVIPSTASTGILWGRLGTSLYLSSGSFLVVVAVFLMTLPIMMGYSNPLDTLLNNALLQYISKMSYSVYMFHGIYITWRNLNSASTSYLSAFYILVRSFGDLVPILAGGVLLAVCVQFPLAALVEEWKSKKNHQE